MQDGFEKRKKRNRFRLRLHSNGKFRLNVFRSSKHIYAQIIDDVNSRTLVSASSVDKELRLKLKNGANIFAAKEVGLCLAKRAVSCGITSVIFDRGAYAYHGRVKSLALAANEGGLVF